MRFCAIDCSAEALRQTRATLARELPELPEAAGELQAGGEAAHLECSSLHAGPAIHTPVERRTLVASLTAQLTCWASAAAAAVELEEAEYLAGVQACRERHPEALLSLLWLGSSGGGGADGLQPAWQAVQGGPADAPLSACLSSPNPRPPALFSLAVGNFSSAEAAELLCALRRAAGERCQLLLCCDLWKSPEVLRRAYDDSQGGGAAAAAELLCLQPA